VVSLSDSVWLPDPHLRERADARWLDLQSANARLYDGPMIQVAGVHRNGAGGATIQAFPCQYRWYAVQVSGQCLDTGCRPLGVKGVTWCGERVLIARRAAWTMCFSGCWEMAPSGGVQPGQSPESAIASEFTEEVGGTLSRPPRAEAVLYDDAAKTWEVVLRLEVSTEQIDPPTHEYSEFKWCHPSELPTDLTPIARRIVG
jgi:8-oxo-dGTP pyrophosphatase MutT (NUDIX family)